MPKIVAQAIVWLAEKDQYVSYESGSADSRPAPNEKGQWLAWLAGRSSFSFQGQQGHLTLRKESRARREEYWYAYRCQNRRTLKRYAGRTGDLAIARLEEIASEISTAFTSAQVPREESAASADLDVHSASLPVLLPRLSLPRLHRSLIARERLWSQLDTSLEYQLTLLCAPAGFGKTTLVRQWIAERSEEEAFSRLAWISLDSGDNDPTRFWEAIFTATQTWYAGAGQRFLDLLHSSARSYMKTLTLEVTLTAFLNEAARQTTPGLLILEDYHLINESRVHEGVNFFLAHLPETLHVVLITRQEPPLLLARLRANGGLKEIRTADLRFTLAESAAFLKEFSLTAEDLEHLDTYLEGWAAGLRLLALSLQGKTTRVQIEHALSTFRGSHRPILDYFVTEVLHTQPEVIQDFLLRTSILSRLTPDLCIAITGCQESARLLEGIERNNLFLEALDARGAWYRYHALFAEAMQHEARRRLGKDAFYALSHAASCWFEQQGLLAEAVETALKACEYRRAAELIERLFQAPQIQENREYHTQRRWLEQLPTPLLEQSPLLCFGYAIALTFDRNMHGFNHLPSGQVNILLLRAEEGWRAREDFPRLGAVYAFRAITHLRQGKLAGAAASARQALALLPEAEVMWRNSSLNALAFEALQAGSLNEARLLFEQVESQKCTRSDTSIHSIATLFLSIICFAQGKLHQAARYYRAFAHAKNQREAYPASILVSLPMTLILYVWNELDQLQEHIQHAFELTTEFSSTAQNLLRLAVEIPGACLQHARGETEQAIQRLVRLWEERPVEEDDFPFYFYREVLHWLVRFSLFLEDRAGARRWLNELAWFYSQHGLPRVDAPLLKAPASSVDASITQLEERARVPAHLYEQKILLNARLALLENREEDALALLTPLIPEAQAAGRGHNLLLVKLLMAQVYAARKQPALARQWLLEAVEQGYPEGYQRVFLDEGRRLEPLLRDLLLYVDAQPLHGYIQALLHNFALMPRRQSQRGTHRSDALIDPLSPQEQRVLRLLVAGRSNPEIARELVVSVNTIRTQIQSIYRKLQVNNRRAASEMARRLQLG